MYYIGENYAEKYRTADPPVRGADGQHISLSVQVFISDTQHELPCQRELVSDHVREQAKKALSTGSGPGADGSTCIRFSWGVGACGWSQGPGVGESGA